MSDSHAIDIRVYPDSCEGLAEMIAGKFHGIKLTECHLDDHGSITIDADILEAARMLPLEFVYIWNTATGECGRGVCHLNGPASRACKPGGEVIVASSRRVPAERRRMTALP